MPDVTIQTPKDFIDFHTAGLRTYLKEYGLQVNKLGLIGYIFNLLGWITYDSKQYSDKLFQEAFVATAKDEFNLFLHSIIYGYRSELAQYAVASGSFVFDFSVLPGRPSTIIRRDAVFSNIKFNVEGHTFVTDCKYRFIEDNDQYYGIIYSGDDMVFIPSSSARISLPFKNVLQVNNQLTSLQIQDYPYGTHFSHTIDTKGKFLSDIKVYIGEKEQTFDIESFDSTNWAQYQTRPIKYFERPNEEVVFLRNIADSKYLLEFGSGDHGRHVPDREAVLDTYITSGDAGNINIAYNGIGADLANSYMILQRFDGVLKNASCQKELLSISFDHSEGGSNPLSGEDLRRSIINFIQTRDNFISEEDFYNIGEKYYKNDFKFLFRKISFANNIMYLCRSFRDRYQNVVYATNWIQKLLPAYEKLIQMHGLQDNDGNYLLDNDGNYLISSDSAGSPIIETDSDPVVTTNINRLYTSSAPRQTAISVPITDNNGNIISNETETIFAEPTLINSELEIEDYFEDIDDDNPGLELGYYEYYIEATDYMRTLKISDKVIGQRTDTTKNSLKLTWNSIEAAVKYVIYRRKVGQEIYQAWDVFDNEFIDIGGTSTSTLPVTNEKIMFYPEYMIKDKVFISPFIYKYNEYMDWFEGFLLYESIIVNFSEIRDQDSTEPAPLIYFNIIYDKDNYKTIFYVKSHQNIEHYRLSMRIYGLDVVPSLSPNNPLDNNTLKFEYTSTEYGLIWEPISIELSVTSKLTNRKLLTGQTKTFYQLYNISDQVKLSKYTLDRQVEFQGSPYADDLVKQQIEQKLSYVVDVPVIDRDIFRTDENYYLNKFFEFIYSNDFSETRFPSDEIHFRFLNTYYVDKLYIDNVVRQKYSFNLFLPLKLRVYAYINRSYLDSHNVDLVKEKSELLFELADTLQKKYTGTNISMYSSQIDDLVHSGREFIKRVIVVFKDSKGTILKDGIENYNDDKIFKNIIENSNIGILDQKLTILKYTPTFFYWDLDDILLEFIYSD